MKKFFCIALAVTLVVLGGCSSSTNTQNDDKKTVTASFYPVYIFTLNLLNGTDVDVECMAQNNTGCLHDYTLTARDVKLLNDSDALVINGAGMESFIEDACKNIDTLAVIDSSEGIEVICENSQEHEHSDEHTHSEEHKHSGIGHAHSHEENSHIWLSVSNAKSQVRNIANGLKKVFPEYSEKIETNFSEYTDRLQNLEKDRDAFSGEINGKSVISFHAAYDYLAIETGMVIFDTIESDEGGEPSAKQLARLSEEIKEHNIKALFTEPNYEGSSAQVLSNETGAKIFILNPVTDGEKSLTAYEDIMRENYKTILKAVK